MTFLGALGVTCLVDMSESLFSCHEPRYRLFQLLYPYLPNREANHLLLHSAWVHGGTRCPEIPALFIGTLHNTPLAHHHCIHICQPTD
jgi:hypothetical protein